MNQILSVDTSNDYNIGEEYNRKRNNGTADIRSIIKFFAVAILIFGIVLIGNGSYAMYKEIVIGKMDTKPTIIIEDYPNGTEINIKVQHDKPLEKVTYKWGNKKTVDMKVNGSKKIEELITIPNGTNKLKVYAIDINGQEIEIEKEYTILGNINIDIKLEKNKIKIKAEGKEKLSHMTYRWDEEEEKKVEINALEKEELIEIPEGLHKLTVIVVDENNKTETREQEVKGVTKPKVEATADDKGNCVVKASDAEGITKIEFIRNGTDKERLDLTKVWNIEKRKKVKYRYPLKDGENKIEIRVYNESEVCTVINADMKK